MDLKSGRKKILGEAFMALFWTTLGFKGRIFYSSEFSTEKTLISASAILHCARGWDRQKERRGRGRQRWRGGGIKESIVVLAWQIGLWNEKSCGSDRSCRHNVRFVKNRVGVINRSRTYWNSIRLGNPHHYDAHCVVLQAKITHAKKNKKKRTHICI